MKQVMGGYLLINRIYNGFNEMKNTLFDLSDQVAIITGGGKGLGQAIALGMAGAGARTIIIGRTLEPLEETVAEIAGQGGSADFHQMDILDDQSVKDLVADTLSKHGKIDILVNNVGAAPTGKAQDISRDAWRSVMDLNLNSLFHLSQLVGEHMIEAKSGNIINIASVLGKMATPFAAPYCASKAAVIHTTRALAVEWAPYNIRVNCIAPGFFKTDMTQVQQEDERLHKYLKRKIPFRRMGEPEEIAGAAVFLASRASTYVTGSTIFVDGGYSIW